ncbi:hypothetical protein DPMN_022492 [Dreissena polymorpha]|uniref:Uncharacterized protein n=1 Tax=Dreissena polymorpha TaxID=45954 RepID=A0A9D4NQD1_DREPO|nr:hypothetical protein DPMN_022492 [Dreissena polymorpha]
MSRVRLLVATVTAVFTCLSSTLACYCVYNGETTKDIYCRSDYAIVAKILSETPISLASWAPPTIYEYKFEVLENYK